MIRKVMNLVIKKYRWFHELKPFIKAAYRHGRGLELQQNNLRSIESGDILLFCTMKNEGYRLSYFLEYYRRLGVDHFIFVDNGSTDGTAEVLAPQSDVTRFYTEGSYKTSNFGMHWLNYLLFKFGRGHWCMTCDPDEFIVYPHSDSRDLKDLTEYLSSIRQDSFFTVMVDMYGQGSIAAARYTTGANPLDICPYFDKAGYYKRYDSEMQNLFVQGGVRQRVFSKTAPATAPALNKVPLIKWKWNYCYVSSMHMALPRRLNRCVESRKVTGALLHFKFISQLDDKVKEELSAKQHYNDSAEYKQYSQVIKNQNQLYHSQVSERYEGWETLLSRGLINLGEW